MLQDVAKISLQIACRWSDVFHSAKQIVCVSGGANSQKQKQVYHLMAPKDCSAF